MLKGGGTAEPVSKKDIHSLGLRNLTPNGSFLEPSYGYPFLKRALQSHHLSTLYQLQRTLVVYLVATKKLSLTNTKNVRWLKNGIAT
jgi:hypothetical protein